MCNENIAAEINCEQYNTGIAVKESKIGKLWRGTGLGQLLYDKAIEEAKTRGCDKLWSDDELTEDAHGAWGRLGKRYSVRFNKPQNRYVMDLAPAGKLVHASAEDSGLWTQLKASMSTGIVYHGTTAAIAEIIQKDGFRGLEFGELLVEVLALYGKTIEDLPPERMKQVEFWRRSYESEHHLVSTTPGGEIATRWAGDGGEVYRQVEAEILGVHSTREVLHSRLKGDPAVVVAKIKDFESTPYYERATRGINYWDKVIASGESTPEQAFRHYWHEYSNYAVPADQLEVISVLTGEAVEALKTAPPAVK